jgi:hypothetical protein
MKFAPQAALTLCLGVGFLAGGCATSETGSGNPGTAGSIGAAGTTGAAGRTGSAGATGTAGATGSAGTTGTAGTSGGTPSGGGTVSGCRMFPQDNPWNQDVSATALHPMNATYMANMNPTRTLHPDWGTMTDNYGIPYTSGTGATPQPITWTTSYGARESDKLACPTGTNQFCYPIPHNAPIEGGPSADPDADRHILYIDTAGGPDNCTLYELYLVQNPTGTSGFMAASGAIFHLGSNALRPDGWTSADAAGLPILPGLVRLEEVTSGEIKHAIRFTMNSTSQGFIHPATHQAGDANTALPPMGLRLRLKASYNVGNATGPALVILTAMKKYGIILADNGSDWYFTGDSDNGWEPHMDSIISAFGKIHGSDFEVVNTGPVLTE